MAKGTKAAPPPAGNRYSKSTQKTAPRAPRKPAAPAEGEPVTLDQLLDGAQENIDFQMQQPHFEMLEREDHVNAAINSLVQEVARNPDLTDLRGKKLRDYIADQLA